MTDLSEVFDLELLSDMLEHGYVKRTLHPNGQLSIYNYTPKAQFEKVWNDVTLQCRGLIINRNNLQVLARPFKKFFNLSEYGPEFKIPDEPFRVFEKMDGSLGILYHDGEDWAIATRGSFASEQAIWATEHLRTRYASFVPEPGHTYLFEIIYPENRIVVDYEGLEDLVLLDVIEVETGRQGWDVHWNCWGGPWVDEHEFDNVQEMAAMERPNREGFVLVFQSGLRVKVKHEEYVRLHAIVTNTSSRTIWEILATGASMDALLAFVPDEFADWARKTAESLTDEVEWIKAVADLCYATVTVDLAKANENFTRKDFALAIKDRADKALLFRLYDGKGIDDIAWKMAKPERTLPFRDQEAAA